MGTDTDQPHKPGYYRQVWDRTDNSGRTVANGVYFIELRTEGEAAKRSRTEDPSRLDATAGTSVGLRAAQRRVVLVRKREDPAARVTASRD